MNIPDLTDTIEQAEKALGRRLGDPVDLGGSSRSRVLRCRVVGTAPETVVVKHFLADGGQHVREAIGLSLLDRTPELLARSDDGRVLVIADLGTLPTLADLLLADDAEAAWAGARGWARELGAMLGRSRAVLPEARQRLSSGLSGGPAGWDAVADLRCGLERLVELAPADANLGAIAAELDDAARLVQPGDADVLWPTDTSIENLRSHRSSGCW